MQNNLALVKDPAILEQVEIYYATVIRTNDGSEAKGYTLLLPNDIQIFAKKAEGCLLVPEENDLVLATFSGNDEQGFILQVLVHTSKEKTFNLGIDATISGKNIRLESQSEICISAPEVNLSGIRGSATFTHSLLNISFSEFRAKKAVYIVHSLERIINTVTENLVNSFRSIKGIEQTKASRIKTIISGRFLVKSRQMTLSAEEDVAIDGKKINMG